MLVNKQLFGSLEWQHWRDWGRWLMACFTVYLAGYIIWLFFGWGDEQDRVLINDSLAAVVPLFSVVMGLRASQNRSLDQRTRRSWLLIALSFASLAAGDIAWLYYEVILGTSPFPSLADAAYLSFFPFLIWGLLSFPSIQHNTTERIKFWLDSAIIMVGATMMIWYFLLEPIVMAQGDDVISTVLAMAYPIGDLVMLFGIITILLGQFPAKSRNTLYILAVGLVFLFAADITFAKQQLQAEYQSASWLDAVWALGYYFLALSGDHQRWEAVKAAKQPSSKRQLKPLNLLPYSAIALGYGLLIVVILQNWIEPLGGLVLGSIALTSLVVVRQVAAVRENTRLILEREQALAANRAKSAFLATMSHELRTPLTAIMGYRDLIAMEAERCDYEPIMEDLEQIRTSGKHLLALIGDVLDLSKIEAGKMELHLETFMIEPLLDEVAGTSQPLIEQNSNKLVVQYKPGIGTMQADMTKVRQTIYNLLSNATKFTANGTITVTMAVKRFQDRDWLQVQVSDTGIGMTAEQIRNIFNPFTQADPSTTREYGGTGLGLALSQHYCRMMGGDLLVESEPGKGSTFTIQLPLHVAEPMVV